MTELLINRNVCRDLLLVWCSQAHHGGFHPADRIRIPARALFDPLVLGPLWRTTVRTLFAIVDSVAKRSPVDNTWSAHGAAMLSKPVVKVPRSGNDY